MVDSEFEALSDAYEKSFASISLADRLELMSLVEYGRFIENGINFFKDNVKFKEHFEADILPTLIRLEKYEWVIIANRLSGSCDTNDLLNNL